MGCHAILLLLVIAFVNGQISLNPDQACGIALEIEDRVVGGTNITAEEAPWNIILELKKNENPDKIVTHCGGSILTPTIIITAAHCLWQNNGCPEEIRNMGTAEECHDRETGCPNGCVRIRPQDINVYAGVSRISPKNKPPQTVKTIYLHDKWEKNSPTLTNIKAGHDLAMIELKKGMTFSQEIQAICLPYQNLTLHAGRQVIINGYGFVDGFKRTPAEFLQQGRMQIVAKDTCSSEYNEATSKGTILGDQLCAIGDSTSVNSPTVDSCNGDSGSGLVTPVGSPVVHVQVGLVSFGQKYCSGGLPGVYTNIVSHVQWIKHKLKDIANGIGPKTCSSIEPCKVKENCPYIKQQYNVLRTAEPEERKRIVNKLKSLICNSQEKTFCCPAVQDDDQSCPSTAVCLTSSSCGWYQQELEQIRGFHKESNEYIDAITLLKQTICNKKEKKICCPRN